MPSARKASTDKPLKSSHSTAAVAEPERKEYIRRLASVAVQKNHANALSRYLAAGLDPNAICYEPMTCRERPLLVVAAENDALECFLALLAAGAEQTYASTHKYFHCWRSQGNYNTKNRRILQHMFDSGALDPNGDACPEALPGFDCIAMAMTSTDETALEIVLAAQAERESDAIKEALSKSYDSKPRRRPSL